MRCPNLFAMAVFCSSEFVYLVRGDGENGKPFRGVVTEEKAAGQYEVRDSLCTLFWRCTHVLILFGLAIGSSSSVGELLPFARYHGYLWSVNWRVWFEHLCCIVRVDSSKVFSRFESNFSLFLIRTYCSFIFYWKYNARSGVQVNPVHPPSFVAFRSVLSSAPANLSLTPGVHHLIHV